MKRHGGCNEGENFRVTVSFFIKFMFFYPESCIMKTAILRIGLNSYNVCQERGLEVWNIPDRVI